MSRYTSSFCNFLLSLLVLGVLLGCGGSSSGSDDKVTLSDEINSEAEDLGDFPSDAEVVEMEEITVNGEDITGTESVELDDTENSDADVSVTLPSSLSRSRGVVRSLQLWLNGEKQDVEFDPETRKAVLKVPLNLGRNYFCFIIQSDSGKEYRSLVVRITRVAKKNITTSFNLKYATSSGEPLSDIGEITLVVSGEDYEEVTAEFTGVNSGTIDIPAGTSLTFEVLARVSEGDDTGALSFSGSVNTDISESSHSVDIDMHLHESKLVVPDIRNSRLVMIDSMEDTDFSSWKEMEFLTGYYYYVDVDIDDAGAIFAVNDDTLYRIDHFSDGMVTLYDGYSDIRSVAVDNQRRCVYVAADSNLYEYMVDTEVNNTINGAADIWESDYEGYRSIETEGNGIIYVTGDKEKICKYDVSSGSIISSVIASNSLDLSFGSRKDILYHNGKVYVSQNDGYIVEFNTDLEFQNSSAFSLDGPRNFIGRLTDLIVFIDDSDSNYDALKSLNSVTDADTVDLGSTGADVGEFHFFESI